MWLTATTRFGDLDTNGRGRIVVCDQSGYVVDIITYPFSRGSFIAGMCINAAIHDSGYRTAGYIIATSDSLIVTVMKENA